jgi:hypothetical protein
VDVEDLLAEPLIYVLGHDVERQHHAAGQVDERGDRERQTAPIP